MLKVAYIGGGSMFLPSIFNGLVQVERCSYILKNVRTSDDGGAGGARTLSEAGEGVHFALYDIAPERAERMARYAAIVAKGTDTPLSASVSRSLEEAIEGAGLVYLSIAHHGLHEGWKALAGTLQVEPHGEGPARTAYEGAKIFGVCLPIGEEMKRRAAPNAVFATLVNPTDVVAGAFQRRFGFTSCGVCCEVGGLIGMLGHHLGHRFGDFELDHVGVNHMGWVLGLRIRGEDAYSLVRGRLPELARQPDFHPNCLHMVPVLRLTGHIRSSAYHRWPHTAGEGVDWEAAMRPWAGKRERQQKALDDALASGQPIADDEPTHPERSVFQYRELGRQIGEMMAAMATGDGCDVATRATGSPSHAECPGIRPSGRCVRRPRVALAPHTSRVPHGVPLQVRNGGATAQFPAESWVEVPTLVAGTRIQPLAVGKAPEWLIANERAFALSRMLTSEWLAEPKVETLHKALSVFPMFGVVEDMLGLAGKLQEERQ